MTIFAIIRFMALYDKKMKELECKQKKAQTPKTTHDEKKSTSLHCKPPGQFKARQQPGCKPGPKQHLS